MTSIRGRSKENQPHGVACDGVFQVYVVSIYRRKTVRLQAVRVSTKSGEVQLILFAFSPNP